MTFQDIILQTFKGFCGVSYYELDDIEEVGHRKKGHRHYGKFEEKVEIDKEAGKYEKIEVPDVDDCQRATVLHDFEKVCNNVFVCLGLTSLLNI